LVASDNSVGYITNNKKPLSPLQKKMAPIFQYIHTDTEDYENKYRKAKGFSIDEACQAAGNALSGMLGISGGCQVKRLVASRVVDPKVAYHYDVNPEGSWVRNAVRQAQIISNKEALLTGVRTFILDTFEYIVAYIPTNTTAETYYEKENPNSKIMVASQKDDTRKPQVRDDFDLISLSSKNKIEGPYSILPLQTTVTRNWGATVEELEKIKKQDNYIGETTKTGRIEGVLKEEINLIHEHVQYFPRNVHMGLGVKDYEYNRQFIGLTTEKGIVNPKVNVGYLPIQCSSYNCGLCFVCQIRTTN
jgi:hypothetical protein